MTETPKADDWLTVPDAAERIGRPVTKVYAWLRRPAEETKIRTMILPGPNGNTKRVHVPSLIDYISTLRPGNPRLRK